MEKFECVVMMFLLQLNMFLIVQPLVIIIGVLNWTCIMVFILFYSSLESYKRQKIPMNLHRSFLLLIIILVIRRRYLNHQQI